MVDVGHHGRCGSSGRIDCVRNGNIAATADLLSFGTILSSYFNSTGAGHLDSKPRKRFWKLTLISYIIRWLDLQSGEVKACFHDAASVVAVAPVSCFFIETLLS